MTASSLPSPKQSQRLLSQSTSAQQVFGYAWPHRLFSAHAGTGKTHRLSARYLRLICHGAPANSIIASTFTRKAAGEIRDRIVLRLAKAATGDQQAVNDLRDATGGLGQAHYHSMQAADDLDRLLQQLSQLSITTIDGFLQRCVNVLQQELGIDRVQFLGAEDSPAIQAAKYQAMEQCLDDIAAIQQVDPENNPDSDVGEDADQLIITLLRGVGMGRQGRSSINLVRRALDKRYALFREQPLQESWDLGEPPWPALSLEDLEQAIEQLAAGEGDLATSKTGQPDGRFKKAWLADLEQAKDQQWIAFISSGICSKIVNEEETFYRKEIPAELIDRYHPLIAHATSCIWQDLAEQSRSAWYLLQFFHRRFVAAKATQGLLSFSDLPHVLSQQPSEVIDELTFRLDAHIQHLLLDEFQDTSRMQWLALAPLATHMLAHHDEHAAPSCCWLATPNKRFTRGAVAVARSCSNCNSTQAFLPTLHKKPWIRIIAPARLFYPA